MRPVDVDAQLLAGEKRREAVAVGDARLVATSHRLLVVRPDGDPIFRAVERPNVLGVESGTDAPDRLLPLAARALVAGPLFVAGGLLVPLDGLATDLAVPESPTAGGTLAAVARLLALVALLDEALLLAGLLAVAVGLALSGWHLSARDPVVVVRVSGGDPVRLPGDEADVERVRTMLAER